MEFCQSCQIKKVKVIEDSDNNSFPYKLCKSCRRRLLNRALRPLEFFNLKAKHGETYLLHDDFYDYETGIAGQPDIEVIDDSNLRFPKLPEIESNMERVIDFGIVQFELTEEVAQALRRFDKKELLTSLDIRIQQNRLLDYKIYSIVAQVLGNFAEDWVRKEWPLHTDEDFTIFAEMLAHCLPSEESFDYLTDELDKITSASKLNEYLDCLAFLQTEKSLDWIENNIYRMQNLSSSWGLVAASSKFSWKRAKKWLDQGRPLSLIALDALQFCAVTEDSWGSSPWFRENPQKLLNPDKIENMNKVLADYLQNDDVPRTRGLIGYITESWDNILKLENAT
ncbi:MAG: hypothetical protein R2747_18650 [Pyrinomonadaceae bacterium]